MENNKNAIEKIIQETSSLIDSYVKLFRLEITISITHVISVIVIVLTLGTILAFIGFFLSIALAYFISAWLAIALPYSFLMIAGLYLLIFIVVVKAKQGIKNFIFKVVERVINHPKNENFE